MPHKYAKSAQQQQKEGQDKARKREAKKARQCRERKRADADARAENEAKPEAGDMTLLNEFSTSTVQGKGKAVDRETERTNPAKERDEEKHDQEVHVSGKAPGVNEQQPEEARSPLPDRDELVEELNRRLEIIASSSEEDNFLTHARYDSSDDEESNELSSEEEFDYDHARQEFPAEGSGKK